MHNSSKSDLAMKIRASTKRFLDTLFPPLVRVVVPVVKDKRGYIPNSIIWRNFFLYGGQGSGKSETVRKLVEEAVRRYGEENVNAIQVPATHLLSAFKYLDDKPIQILFCDDFTMVKHPNGTLQKYFEIRHIWSKRTGRKNGYIITIEGTHRFHSLPKEFRNLFDFLLVRSAPDNLYDRRFLENYFTRANLDKLARIEVKRLENRELFKYTLWRDKIGNQGFLKLGLADRNYFNTVKTVGRRTRLVPYYREEKRIETREEENIEEETLAQRVKEGLIATLIWSTPLGLGIVLEESLLTVVGVFCLFCLLPVYALLLQSNDITEATSKVKRRESNGIEREEDLDSYFCNTCGRRLTKEEYEKWEGYCQNCFYEDIGTAMIFDEEVE